MIENALIAALFLLLGAAFGYAVAHYRTAARLASARSDAIRLQTQLDTLSAARAELANHFQVLANQILDAQSRKFTDQNRDALAALLEPLGLKISDFRKKVEDVHLADAQQRSALKQQVELLAQQSRDVGQKADALADALKGDNKLLGTWGELALERLLDAAGLAKGRDYDLQVSVPDGSGGRAQPDAVVRLPDRRCILIDAKMSLKDYLDHVNASTDDARAAALKAHLASVEAHIKGLAARRYPDLPAFQDASPDFVLMFIPNEPALALALAGKPALYETAARANIIPVGPGGLLAALRLVGQLWRQENQRRSIDDVFDAVRKIYEKYVGFAEDMDQIQSALQKTQAAYDAALKKLATGDGNLVRQMDKFVKANIIKPKRLPPPAFQDTDESES
ncbi:MAG: DNA recombination protein RmuC [Lentisphaerae bacterium]|nr:DNA recombination protein RmuC [Lentisphaerota bacterium]